jgi:hypothetical protein
MGLLLCGRLLCKYYFTVFASIGEGQEEDDSSSDSSSKDGIPLVHLFTQTNVVGNPELKKNQAQRRLQPSQVGEPTRTGTKKAEKTVLKQTKKKKQAISRTAHGS